MPRPLRIALVVLAALVLIALAALGASAALDRPARIMMVSSTVDASKGEVWAALTDFDDYDQWNPTVDRYLGSNRYSVHDFTDGKARCKAALQEEAGLPVRPDVPVFGIVSRLVKQEKLSVLLVEQNATMALAVADHGYVMENGRIVLEGPAAKLRDNSDIKEFYLGLNEGGARKSYRDTKHYKRRKRWLS